MMYFACFTGLYGQRNSHAQAFADQVMVQGGDSEQRRNGRLLAIDSAITQNEDVDLFLFDQPSRLLTQLLDSTRKAFRSARRAKQ